MKSRKVQLDYKPGERGRRHSGGRDRPHGVDRCGRLDFADYFDGARDTHAFALVYEKYFGKNAHRRLPAFKDRDGEGAGRRG